MVWRDQKNLASIFYFFVSLYLIKSSLFLKERFIFALFLHFSTIRGFLQTFSHFQASELFTFVCLQMTKSHIVVKFHFFPFVFYYVSMFYYVENLFTICGFLLQTYSLAAYILLNVYIWQSHLFLLFYTFLGFETLKFLMFTFDILAQFMGSCQTISHFISFYEFDNFLIFCASKCLAFHVYIWHCGKNYGL